MKAHGLFGFSFQLRHFAGGVIHVPANPDLIREVVAIPKPLLANKRAFGVVLVICNTFRNVDALEITCFLDQVTVSIVSFPRVSNASLMLASAGKPLLNRAIIRSST